MNKAQLNQIHVFEVKPEEKSKVRGVIQIENENSIGVKIKLSGDLNYSVVKDMTSLINQSLDSHEFLIIDLDNILSLDISVASALEDILKSAARGKSITIMLKRDEIYSMLLSLGILDLFPPENIKIIDGNK